MSFSQLVQHGGKHQHVVLKLGSQPIQLGLASLENMREVICVEPELPHSFEVVLNFLGSCLFPVSVRVKRVIQVRRLAVVRVVVADIRVKQESLDQPSELLRDVNYLNDQFQKLLRLVVQETKLHDSP